MAGRRTEHRSNAVTLTIRVVPRSSRVSIEQESATQYKVKLTSPPVDGAANSQLIEVLSKKLAVPRRCVEITHGEASRIKQVQISGINPDIVSQLLLAK